TGFFQAYTDLDISGDLEVGVGAILNHVRDTYGIPYEDFGGFDQDVEQFMTHLDIQLRYLAAMMNQRGLGVQPNTFGQFIQANQAFDQSIFLAAHILNEIQNGPISGTYGKFVAACDESDVLATFNWDTL